MLKKFNSITSQSADTFFTCFCLGLDFYQPSCIKKGFFERVKNQNKELKMNKLQDMACNWNFIVTSQYIKSKLLSITY